MSGSPLPAGVRLLLRASLPDAWSVSVEGDLEEEWVRSGASRGWLWKQALGIAAAQLGERSRRLAARLPGRSRRAGRRLGVAALRTRGGRLMMDFWRDLRFGARSLRRAPGFTLAASLTLALGIGSSAALYSFVDAFLFRPLPFHEPEQLVHLWGTSRAAGYDKLRVSWPVVEDWRERARSFAGIAAFNYTEQTLTGEEPLRLPTGLVSADAFEVLGVDPLLGRGFLAGEDRPGAERVAVLSYGLWQGRYAGDAQVLGRSLEIEGRRHTIVGVMPPEFAFPLNTTTLWTPYELDPARYDRDTRSFQVVARLAPGVSPQQAQAELDLVSADLAREHPRFDAERGANVASLRSALNFVDEILRPMSVLLGVAVSFLLLLTCANVASLLLARAVTRTRELAIRAAMGAGRQRMLRQMLTESGLLALLAGAVGLALAWVVLRALDSAVPPDLYRVGSIALDPTAVAVTASVCLLATLLSGLVPALQASRVDPQTGLREGALSSGGGRGGHRLLGVLTAVQIGLAATLLLGSVLLTRSLSGLSRVDPGFRAEGVLSAKLILPREGYDTPERRVGFQRALLERARAIPGVESAALTNYLPLNHESSEVEFAVGGGETREGSGPRATYLSVSPGYFETLGIQLLRGRAFRDADDATSAGVAIVNQSLAARHYPRGDALGAQLRLEVGSEEWVDLVIVGVVADSRHSSLQETELQIYRPQYQQPWGYLRLLTRGPGEPLQRSAGVRQSVAAIDPNLPATDLRSLQSVVDEFLLPQRGLSLTLALLAAGALLLSAVGIYGVIGQFVSRRTREIGVRMAIGATRGSVLALVLRRGLLLAGAGVAGGLLVAAVVARLLESFLFGVGALDPVSFAATGAFLLVVSALAAALPARRAARVDPLVALRWE